MVTWKHFQILRTIPFLIAVCLIAFPTQAKYSGGTGEPNDPYRIATAADLIALGETPGDYDKHFVLTADIDLDPNLPGRKVFDRAVVAGDTDPTKDGFQGNGFRGIFDGNGHTISHLTMKGTGYLGLFGCLERRWDGRACEVRDLGVVDVNVTGSGHSVGGLVGYSMGSTLTDCYSIGSIVGAGGVGGLVGSMYGAVTDCYSTGGVSGDQCVGGLVGYISALGNVTRCYSTGEVNGNTSVGGLVGGNEAEVTESYAGGNVTGQSFVGGLVGSNGGRGGAWYSAAENLNTGEWIASNGVREAGYDWYEGRICNCYSVGAVTGRDSVGGLVGQNEVGVVTRCYSTGGVRGASNAGGLVGCGDCSWFVGRLSVVTVCFWDTQTSGQTTSAGGTGKTTADMQTAITFLEAGWDFVGETVNGTEDIWWIFEGLAYPRLLRVSKAPWAFSPHPHDGATDVIPPWMLSWHAGMRASYHDVYFGEDRNVVANAKTESPGVYRRRQPADATTYDPGDLEWAKTYYWRIDEVNEGDPNSSWKGNVWSFTTADYILVSAVDDFEGYTDERGSRIWEIWEDGFYLDVNSPGNGTGSCVGNECPPFVEQTIVHDGKQAMPMDYNDGKPPYYSEAHRTWGEPQDWTVDGADTLTLYFRGEAGNARELLYVGIEDSAGRSAAVVHPDAQAVLATEWQKWHTALGEVRAAGVDVAAVQKMVIGVGDRKNPKPGGTGRIYIDDIRLTKRMP